jgi:hypothetical protein
MLRRPLFVACVLGCVASMLTAGAVTARLALSVPLYWSFVPITEMAAVLIVTAARRETMSRSRVIDLYFTGHGAWTLALLAIGLTLSSAPGRLMWQLLTTMAIAVLVLVIGWSAYIDYWFFRTIFAATPRRALRDTALVRLITWPVVFIVFALPAVTPWGIAAEIIDALKEIF